MTRYEGWALIPVVLPFCCSPGDFDRPCSSASIASIPPLYWLAHNWWYYGNALEFYNGPYSHKMIYERAVQANMQRYPGDHDWPKAFQYYRAAAESLRRPGVVLDWVDRLGRRDC